MSENKRSVSKWLEAIDKESKINFLKFVWREREKHEKKEIKTVVFSLALWTNKQSAGTWVEKNGEDFKYFKRTSRRGYYKDIAWDEVNEYEIELAICRLISSDHGFPETVD